MLDEENNLLFVHLLMLMLWTKFIKNLCLRPDNIEVIKKYQDSKNILLKYYILCIYSAILSLDLFNLLLSISLKFLFETVLH